MFRAEYLILLLNNWYFGWKIQIMIAIYLILVNLTAFIMYGLDKQKAVRHKWRLPERTLIGIAVFGGSLGALIGMKVFHHKTRHKKFTIGVPVIIAVQVTAFVLVLIIRP